MRDELFLLGRILFSLVFLRFGVAHLTQTAGSAQYAAYKGVPRARELVLFTGVAMVLAGLAVILGIWMDLAAVGIAVFCLVAGFVMHRFWAETEPQARQAEMAHFFKNVSIAGGALVLAALGGDLPYTITDGAF